MIVEHFQSANIGWLAAAFLIFTASHLLGSVQWWLLLSSEDVRIPWKTCLSYYYVGLFFNNFLIGNLGGDVFRVLDIHRYSEDSSSAVSTVFLDRLAGLFVLSGMAVLTAPWLLLRGEIRTTLQLPLVLLVTGWIILLLLLFSRRFATPFVWIIRRLLPVRWTVKARDVYYKIYTLKKKSRLVGRILLISFFVQGLRIMMHFIVALSLGVRLHPMVFFLVIPIIAIIASIPVSLGGIGMREQTGVLLFGLFGVTAVLAFSVELLAYLIAVSASIPGGVIFLGRRRVRRGGGTI